MVTEAKVKGPEVSRVQEAEHIDFEQFGELLGIPITVRPWWGSNRYRGMRWCIYCHNGLSSYSPRYCYPCRRVLKLTEIVIDKAKHTWECAGGYSGNFYKDPEVQDGKIILWEGPCGFRHPRKGHSQEIKVRDVHGETILIAIWVRQLWSCWLIGVDGRAPFVVPVQRRAATVQEAFDWLMPVMVRRAIAAGLTVKRQGDWYFIPVAETPKSRELLGFPHTWFETVPFSNPALARHVLYSDVNLIYGEQTRHRAEQVVYNSILGTPHSVVPFVKGRVSAPDHEDLYLENWHLAIRNKSTPGGRRENTRGQDD